jgi:predicted SAM-dependent methyltransferase
MTLKTMLVTANKSRWLDVGCGGNLEDGFSYLDTFAEDLIKTHHRARYHRVDIVKATPEQLTRLKQFDLVRLQHVLEHLPFEDGQAALTNCSRLLNPGGIILITVPDLRIHIDKYLQDAYASMPGFVDWARRRVPSDAPASFYFSIFAHSLPIEPHNWCYDYAGLEYQIRAAGKFIKIREVPFSDALAEFPFTHNRPAEDLCVIAELGG